MACDPLVPVTCVVDGVGSAASSAIGNSFAEAMRDGAAWVMRTTIGWWIDVPAVDLTRSPVDAIRGYVLWLAVVVATAGIIWQGVLLVLSRRPEPVLAVGRGLFLLALWSAIGVAGPAAALRAGDEFSSWVLDRAAGNLAAERLVALASLAPVQSPGAVTLLGLLMMLAGLVQAVLMLFREAAVVILSGVVVLAAAGSFSTATRPWLPRVVGWMLALVTYKPAAALVYATALTLTGQGQDPRTVVVGLTMMLLAIIALPVLMKFFTWTAGAATSGGTGALAALAAGSAAAIHARAAFESVPGTAAGQAARVRADLGPAAGPPHPTGATGTPTMPAATPSPSTAASATGTPMAGTATTGAASATASGAAAAATGPGAVVLAAPGIARAATDTARRAIGPAGAALTEEGPQ